MGGCNCNVILIDTESKFIMQRLLFLFRRYVDITSDSENVVMIESCMKNLQILKCFNYNQFELILERLPEIVASNSQVSLVIVDSIASFFWFELDKVFVTIENYLKNYIKRFKSLCEEYQISFLYTRPDHFKPQNGDVEVQYKFELDRVDEKIFVMNINHEGHDKISRNFRILSTGIHFVEKSQNEPDSPDMEGKV